MYIIYLYDTFVKKGEIKTMKRKLLTILLASVCAMSLLVACGDTDSSKSEESKTEDVEEDDEEDEMDEEDKVSADMQLCDTIRSGIQTVLMDPAIVTLNDYVSVT